ncbi:MAG TPA: transcription antitermination factor NusB [Acidimicrobiia bacterium]|nr:transcription antitermination factor NusB [Acidimicrobiia bacterium]
MSRPAPVPTIPARLTTAEFAAAIGRPVEDVQEVLEAQSEPTGVDEMIGPDMSAALAATLGVQINVEPRDLALETLYELETRGDQDHPGLTGRAGRLVAGVLENREDLDHQIESASDHWSVARMPVIDRTILRLGLFELQHDPGVPTGVIVSEAVRLAQMYSTERSGSFVNGVLASLARSARP